VRAVRARVFGAVYV